MGSRNCNCKRIVYGWNVLLVHRNGIDLKKNLNHRFVFVVVRRVFVFLFFFSCVRDIIYFAFESSMKYTFQLTSFNGLAHNTHQI